MKKNYFSTFLHLNIIRNYHYWYCACSEYCLNSVGFRYARTRSDIYIFAAVDPIFVLPYYYCVQ